MTIKPDYINIKGFKLKEECRPMIYEISDKNGKKLPETYARPFFKQDGKQYLMLNINKLKQIGM